MDKQKQSETVKEVLDNILDFVNSWFLYDDDCDFVVEFRNYIERVAESKGVKVDVRILMEENYET